MSNKTYFSLKKEDQSIELRARVERHGLWNSNVIVYNFICSGCTSNYYLSAGNLKALNY